MLLDRVPRLAFTLAALLAGLFAALAFAAPAAAQQISRITCESWQFRPAQCQVPGIVDAQIANVIAGDCRPGNWGFDRRGVWVNNGCRAVFDVAARGGMGGNNGGNWNGGGNGAPGQIVRCESWQFRPARCDMNTRGGVQIQRLIAGDCRPGNWGWDRNGVWVNNGCRADFVSGGGNNSGGNWGGGGGNWGGGGGNPIVECNSIRYQPARCNVRINSGVQVDRVLGGECIQGRTWGWDRGGIWVNNGCRARFRIF